jgi:hypothetical protein
MFMLWTNTSRIPPSRMVCARARKKAHRTRVSNGTALFSEVIDWRTSIARRFKDLVGDIASDLGGADQLSSAQMQLIRRASMVSAECEKQELLAAKGDTEFDVEAYVVKTNCLRRVFETLGLHRVPRPVDDIHTLGGIAPQPHKCPMAASGARPTARRAIPMASHNKATGGLNYTAISFVRSTRAILQRCIRESGLDKDGAAASAVESMPIPSKPGKRLRTDARRQGRALPPIGWPHDPLGLPISVSAAMTSPLLFGPFFSGPSWDRWRTVVKAAFTEKMSQGRACPVPCRLGSRPAIGTGARACRVRRSRRRQGQRRQLARHHGGGKLQPPRAAPPGERAVVVCLAVDRSQARIVHGYISAYFREIRALAALVMSSTRNSISLSNGVDIETFANDYKSVRGRSLLLVIFDELAFWSDETSATPDVEPAIRVPMLRRSKRSSPRPKPSTIKLSRRENAPINSA